MHNKNLDEIWGANEVGFIHYIWSKIE